MIIPAGKGKIFTILLLSSIYKNGLLLFAFLSGYKRKLSKMSNIIFWRDKIFYHDHEYTFYILALQ